MNLDNNNSEINKESTNTKETQSKLKRSVSFDVPKWKETKTDQSILSQTNSYWPKSTRKRLFLPYFAIPCNQHANEIQIKGRKLLNLR